MSMTQEQINADLFDQCKKMQAEIATLRAKAEAYDKGLECFGVFDDSIQLATVSARMQNNLINGYTCRKVRVCEEVES